MMEQGIVREAYKQFVADVEACAAKWGGDPVEWQAPQAYEEHLEDASSRASSAHGYVCAHLCVCVCVCMCVYATSQEQSEKCRCALFYCCVCKDVCMYVCMLCMLRMMYAFGVCTLGMLCIHVCMAS